MMAPLSYQKQPFRLRQVEAGFLRSSVSARLLWPATSGKNRAWQTERLPHPSIHRLSWFLRCSQAGRYREDQWIQTPRSHDAAVEQRRQPTSDLDRVVQHQHAISPRLEGRSWGGTAIDARPNGACSPRQMRCREA